MSHTAVGSADSPRVREALMKFPDRRAGSLQRVVGTYTEVEDNREVVKPIRVYVGNRKALRS